MGKHFTLWIKADCPFCIEAKDELFKQKASHTIHIMDEKLEGLEEIKKAFNHFTVPIVIVEDETRYIQLVGGCAELKGWFSDKSDD